MTDEQIIEMLRASCDKDKVDPFQNDFWTITTEELKRFAKLVAQHEREECAKVCDRAHELMNSSFQGAAAAIRARGTNADS